VQSLADTIDLLEKDLLKWQCTMSSTSTKFHACLVQMTAAASPVSGAIGAVQAGQLGAGQGGELVHELTALMEAGMDVACFDLSQGTLEQHLDLADHLVEVCGIYMCDPETTHFLLCIDLRPL